VGEKLQLSEFLRKIAELGYSKVWETGNRGEFSQRGGVIHIFPINYDEILTIEFEGNYILEIAAAAPSSKPNFKSPKKSDFFPGGAAPFRPGDYVVHIDHGIGIFRCGRDDDYMIEYAAPKIAGKVVEPDTLFVPKVQIKRLSPYLGFKKPEIHRLGTPIWSITKRKAKEDIMAFAKELLKSLAARKTVSRIPYKPHKEPEEEIISNFPHEYTADQVRAIEEVFADMEKPEPMERIVTGDVGFGKTEVALLAAFRTVLNGKQVAVLSPTTILADQHFEVFNERLAGFGVEVARLTRLETIEKIKDIAKKLESGVLDIVNTQMNDLLRTMIAAWSASGDARDSTLMLSARNQTRTELNEMARDVLRSEGKLVGEQPARQLQSVYAQRADTALASTYRPGQTVQFPRALKSLGVGAGEYARVESVNGRDGIVYLDVGGRRVPWAPGLVAGGAKMPPQIFVERETTLAPGERITWTKNDPSLGLTNGQRLNVIATDARRMTVLTEDGRRVEINRGVQSGKHWEHGYATTIYKSQGQTAAQVLVDASSSDKSLLSQKAFLVAVSRQTEGLTLYTDSAEKLRDSVSERTGEKMSAIDTRISVSDVTDRAILAAFRESDARRDAERAAAAAREFRAAAPDIKRPAPSRGLDLER